ncbi:Ran-binding 10 [Micractinium conductrix]|uniref:Ran-binding 10 n=1 Tax=Micractinium conductrix TaxID=554055 RepID=A0A2P6VQ65_9CHLO|nr:Ran-binding 10 [Micractinium conductrix]|eukprot:PSC76243.1 Ran-binding 10 [Micractinium conductrix]
MASVARSAPEPLPSELNTSSGSLAFLEVGKNRLAVKYSGSAQHDNDVGTIQANHPVPRRQLIYYFEVTVKEASGGSISLGFADRNFKQGRHPGFESHSYGYRGDTGRKHHSALPARGEEYGPAFGPGDVVGAGIHLTKHEIFFTKNGQHLGSAFRHVTGHPLYPTIGLHSQGASVQVNFGRGGASFAFDVAAMVARERAQQAEAMQSAVVSAGEVHQLVQDYLLHYGYADSLAAFDAAAGMAYAAAEEGGAAASGGGAGGGGAAAPPAAALLPLRTRLRQLLMAGHTSALQQLLTEQAPELLAAAPAAAAGSAASGGGGDSPGSTPGGGSGDGSGSGGGGFELRFTLACQHYIELIRAGDITGALAYAEGTLSTLRGASPEHDARLRDVVALIAYQQPEQSPLAALLSPAQREATADVANAALLRWQAPPGSPEPQAAVELLLQQLTAVQHELHDMAGGHGPEFDLTEHLPAAPGQPSAQQQAEQAQQDAGAQWQEPMAE